MNAYLRCFTAQKCPHKNYGEKVFKQILSLPMQLWTRTESAVRSMIVFLRLQGK